MPTFTYKAKDKSGTTVTGTLDAESSSQAAAILRERGQLPMDIRQAGRVSARPTEYGSFFARYFIYPLWTGVSIRTLASFFRQMATLLDSGMTLTEALTSIGGRASGRLRVIIDEMKQSAGQGLGLSGAMIRHPRVFSPLQIALVRVGESSGLLADLLARIASYLEYEIKIRQMISKMIVYPVVVLVFAGLVYLCVPNVNLLVSGKQGEFLSAIWPQLRLCVFGGLGLVVALKLIFQFGTVKYIWDAIKVQPPMLGTAARKIAMSRFSRAVALLYGAGVPLSETVSVGADACANYYIGDRIRRAVPALQNGVSLSAALESTGAVMPIVLDMLVTGERTGNTDATLNKVADYMDDEVDVTMHKLGIALMVVGVIAAGIVTLYVLVQLYQQHAANELGNLAQ
jgi:type II secretory pathway component PulF